MLNTICSLFSMFDFYRKVCFWFIPDDFFLIQLTTFRFFWNCIVSNDFSAFVCLIDTLCSVCLYVYVYLHIIICVLNSYNRNIIDVNIIIIIIIIIYYDVPICNILWSCVITCLCFTFVFQYRILMKFGSRNEKQISTNWVTWWCKNVCFDLINNALLVQSKFHELLLIR